MEMISPDNMFQLSLTEVGRHKCNFTNPLTEIILNAIDDMERGIFLVPPPTGIGKSHAVTHMFIQAWLEGKRLWFITARKNNLTEPIANLKREAEKMNQNGELSDRDFDGLMMSILPLHNYIEAWESVLGERKLPIEMTCSDLFHSKNFHTLFETLRKAVLKYRKNKEDPEEELYYADAVSEAERKLRQFVKNDFKAFAEKYKECGSRRKDGAYDQDVVDAYISRNRWIDMVYPYVNINKCNNGRYPIVFATEAKKNVPCDNLMGDTSCLYAQIRNKGGVVIIDEIDQSKVSCRDQLLKANVYNKFKIALRIKENFIAERLEMIINKERDPIMQEKMRSRLVTSRKLISDFESKYGPITTLREFGEECELSMKKDVHIIMETSYTRFFSHKFTYGHRGPAALIDILPDDTDVKEGLPLKKKASQENGEHAVWLHNVIQGLTGIINHFVGSLPFFLEALKIKRNHAQDSAYDFSNIASLLQALNIEIGSDEFNYLQERLTSRGSISVSNMPVISSIYSRGLGISIPSLNEADSERNTTYSFSIDISPEVILATIADRALVIGLSATADVDTAIGNYNYNWIESCGIPVVSLDEDAWAAIAEIQRGRFADIDKVQFDVSYISDQIAGVMLDQSVLLAISNIASMVVEEDEDPSYEERRLSKLISAFSVFNSGDHSSGIALMQRDYGKNKNVRNAFKRVFDTIDPEQEIDVFFANSKKMADMWNNAKQQLANGRRIFFIMSYQSGNTGYNYNYPLSRDRRDFLQVADSKRTYSEKIDVDFMYLAGITNVFPLQNYKKGFDRITLTKQLCIIEELYLRGEISNQKRTAYILLCMSTGRIPLEEQMSWPSYQGEVLKTLIQTLGRFERSPYKRKNVAVLYDSDLVERLDSDYVYMYLHKHKHVNPHTGTVLSDMADKAGAKGAASDRMEIRFSNCATDARRYLNSEYGEIRKGNYYYPEKIARRERLCRFVLEHPTANENDFQGLSWIKELFMRNDQPLYYRFISDTVQIRKHPEYGYRLLESEASNLDDILKVPRIHDFFDSCGYATEWDMEKEYIMSPGLMVNIYMGAVGEEALKALLSTEVIEHISRPEIYELFDFVCNKVPVDAKNYTPEAYPGGKAPNGYDPEKQLDIIAFKLDKMAASAAVYVNLLDDGHRGEGKTILVRGKTDTGSEWERPVLVIRGLIRRDGTVNKTEYHRLIRFIEEHSGAVSAI